MKKLRRKPTYGAAIRLARIAAGLFSKPYGWSFKSIAETLEISERTLARYVSVLRGELRGDACRQPGHGKYCPDPHDRI